MREAFFFPAEPGLLDNTAPQPLALRDGSLTLGLTLLPEAAPAALEGTLVLRDGQTRQFSAATDRVNGEVVRIEVTLRVVK